MTLIILRLSKQGRVSNWCYAINHIIYAIKLRSINRVNVLSALENVKKHQWVNMDCYGKLGYEFGIYRYCVL